MYIKLCKNVTNKHDYYLRHCNRLGISFKSNVSGSSGVLEEMFLLRW
jgi:hypothetical protein